MSPPSPALPAFDHYLELRERFAVSRELALTTLRRVEPLARQALGAHAKRDRLELGDELHLIPVLTSPADNGGWGELMPVWFKPYERPLPIFILTNWAMPAVCLHYWLNADSPAVNVENLLTIFVGSSVLIPFMPATQRGGVFLRHGALTMLLGLLWLSPVEREAVVSALRVGGRRFAEVYRLREQIDLAEAVGRLEAEAFLAAEGNRIGGEEKIRAFLADGERFTMYAALFGGLCFSVSALYDAYGPDWEAWVFQAVNVHYRYATFGLEAWARSLGIKVTDSDKEPA